jgi:predicted RNase H-like nuclease (RuvC/YqgF family)
MDPDLRRKLRKLESANKRVAIENRRLAREVEDLTKRLAKLEASVRDAAKAAQTRDQTVRKLHGAVVKVVRAIGKIEAKLARFRPRPAAAKRPKAAGARAR